jgi:membrane protein involved in D-alanine export
LEFYAQPAFFALLALAVVPAFVLGATGRRIKPYGFAVSLAFLFLLFSHNVPGLVALLFFLLFSTTITFVYLRARPPLLGRVGPFLLLLPLAVYKLTSALWGSSLAASEIDFPAVTLPPEGLPFTIFLPTAFSADFLGFIGISYMTFKTVQVFLESKDGLITTMRLTDYLYFLLFFAPFTSGPIDRSRRFITEVTTALPRATYLDMFGKGLLLFLAGLLYKVVLAAIIFEAYSWQPTRTMTGIFDLILLLKDTYGYGIYLFFDFAGYSLMAMGVGFCFGIRLPRNFRAPFLAVDIKDFWNRWHISLSFWLRDFVFMRFTRIALRRKWFTSRLTPACLGYLLNMGLMGVWHGLTLDYIAYGLFHGLFLAGTEIYQKKSQFYRRYRDRRWYKLLSWAITINLVFFGFALFSGQVLGS